MQLARLRTTQLKHLNGIEARIALISGNGSVTGVGRGRPRNGSNLADALHQILSKAARPLTIRGISDRVQAGGYQSTSANFRGLVNLTLTKDKRFTRTGSGVYQLRPTKAATRPTKPKGKGRIAVSETRTPG